MMKKNLLTIAAIFFIFTCIKAGASETPKRIISLSPNITQIVYALGAWDSIVGVTIYSDFPPEVKDTPKIGGWVNPNMEAIVALKPDLVLLMKDQDTIFGQKLDNLGLKKYVVDSNDSIEDILQSITSLGSVLDKETQAEELASGIKKELEIITLRTKAG